MAHAIKSSILLISLSWRLALGVKISKDGIPGLDLHKASDLNLVSFDATDRLSSLDMDSSRMKGECKYFEKSTGAPDERQTIVLPTVPSKDCRADLQGMNRQPYNWSKADGLVFIDAFMSADQKAAYLIFFTRVHHSGDHSGAHSHGATWERKKMDLAVMHGDNWKCEWLDPSDPSRIVGSGNGVGHVSSDKFTMIVTCPMTASCPTTLLNVNKHHQNELALDLQNIRVCNEPLFKKPGPVLCTQTRVNDIQLALARPWVDYHLKLGFQEVVIYVEEKDQRLLEDYQKKLAEFISAGTVTLVPAFLENMSHDSEAYWDLQQGFEQHCLYRAKGVSKWLGHLDSDEYFDLSEKFKSVSDLVKRASDQTHAIEAKHQFWHVLPGQKVNWASFPCGVTCQDPGITKDMGGRMKMILNTDLVTTFSIHTVTDSAPGSSLYSADFSDELRLNHLRKENLEETAQCSESNSWSSNWSKGSFAQYLKKICSAR